MGAVNCGKAPRAGGVRDEAAREGGLILRARGGTLEGFRGQWHAQFGIARCFLQLLGRGRAGKATRRATLRPVRKLSHLSRAERVVAGAKVPTQSWMEAPAGEGMGDDKQLHVQLCSQLPL